MFNPKLFILLGCLLHSHPSLAVFWGCSTDADCSDIADTICEMGRCVCPPGKQSVLGGTSCVDLAPYLNSQCVEDFQCSHLITNFECRKPSIADVGNCFCRPGNHYFRGRCWPLTEEGEACTWDEQCRGVVADPFSMRCNGVCECAEGYYLRQRGECRRIGAAVGDGCVVDEDCRFDGGACSLTDFTCYNSAAALQSKTAPTEESYSRYQPDLSAQTPVVYSDAAYLSACNTTDDCREPFACSAQFGTCLCPNGYYVNAGRTGCLAELGSPVTSASQCVGWFTEVRDGICTCMSNFYFDEDMRNCIKVARTITDSCLRDENCHTFGVHARCGEPQLWELRSCECDLEYTVWDEGRRLCRLFAGIGEPCQLDSDCLAGSVQAVCRADDEEELRCACPDGMVTHNGLCLTMDLTLGEACQITMECTGTPNTVCADIGGPNNVCYCDVGYIAIDGVCQPAIGGTCEMDADCQIEHTKCANETLTCACTDGFVEHQAACWPRVDGHGAPCNVTEQCVAVMGAAAECTTGSCVCSSMHHYRDGRCWQQTGLFESCGRSSECFLQEGSDRVHCRNSMCQCTFDHPYSEELGTCRSSAASIVGNTMTILIALFYLFMR